MTVEQLSAPCASCPYRKSVRLAFWSIEEYEKLLQQDSEPFGAMFNCHGEAKQRASKRRLCAGWLLDQRRRGVPSLMLRMKLARETPLAKHFEALRDLSRQLYASIAEMFEANYPGRKHRPVQPRRK